VPALVAAAAAAISLAIAIWGPPRFLSDLLSREELRRSFSFEPVEVIGRAPAARERAPS